MIKKKGRPSKWPYAFKVEVAKFYLQHDLNSTEVGERYGIRPGDVRKFAHWYKKEQGIDLNKPKPLSEAERHEVEALQQRISELEKKLDYSSLKVEALETMIDIAEERFELSIRKKSGSRQHKK